MELIEFNYEKPKPFKIGDEVIVDSYFEHPYNGMKAKLTKFSGDGCYIKFNRQAHSRPLPEGTCWYPIGALKKWTT